MTRRYALKDRTTGKYASYVIYYESRNEAKATGSKFGYRLLATCYEPLKFNYTELLSHLSLIVEYGLQESLKQYDVVAYEPRPDAIVRHNVNITKHIDNAEAKIIMAKLGRS
jgi:ribonucleotide reductase alpha subunit